MKWTFRKKLTLLTFVLTFMAISGSTLFLIRLYAKDKMGYAFENQLTVTAQTADRLNHIVTLAKTADSRRLSENPDILLLMDRVCNDDNRFDPPENLNITTLETPWIGKNERPIDVYFELEELHRGCREMNKNTSDPYIRLSTKSGNRFPILPLMIRQSDGIRVAVLSLDGMSDSTGLNTFIIAKSQNNQSSEFSQSLLWSDLSQTETGDLIRSLKIKDSEILTLVKRVTDLNLPSVTRLGDGGIVSIAPVGHAWSVVSVAAESVILAPVYYAIKQSAFLMLGFLFLCMFIGKLASDSLSKPLAELNDAAERFGSGDLDYRLNESGGDEIGSVRTTLNRMASQLTQLLMEAQSKAHLESEIALTQKVQQMLLPKNLLRLHDCEIHSQVKMAQKCGGDWWGYSELKRPGAKPLLLIAIGDVTGHGTASALITAATQGAFSLLNSWLNQDPDLAFYPDQILAHLNRAIFESSAGAMNMTMFLGVVDPQMNQLYCVNAGHNRPYLLTPDKQVRTIGGDGSPLGSSLDTVYEPAEQHPWIPGSKLFLYSDGLIDNHIDGKELYGRKELSKQVRSLVDTPAKTLLEAVLNSRDQAVKGIPQEDDISLVICTYTNKQNEGAT